MANLFTAVGVLPVAAAGVTTPASITTATALVIPTAIQRPSGSGVMECYISIEGTNTSRYTINGTTPTTAVGMLLPGSNPYLLVLVGEQLISAFRIIGTAAGNTITYNFAVRNMH